MAMLCLCEHSGQLRAEALRLGAQRLLGVPRAEDTLAAALLSLEGMGAVVTVDADIWCRVTVTAGGFVDSVECDEPFDGVFFLLLRLARRFPERLVKGAVARGDYAHSRLVSTRMLGALDAFQHAVERHKKSCHTCREGGLCKPAGLEIWQQIWEVKTEAELRWAGSGCEWYKRVLGIEE